MHTLWIEYWFFFLSRFLLLFPSIFSLPFVPFIYLSMPYKYIIKSAFWLRRWCLLFVSSFGSIWWGGGNDDDDGVRIRAGGNKISFYTFRNEEPRPYPRRNPKGKPMRQLSSSQRHLINAAQPASAFDVSRDSQLAAIASGRSIQIWQINTPQMTQSFEEHTGAVTCVSFSPNVEFFASGAEDKTVIVWNLVFSLVVTTFKVNHFLYYCHCHIFFCYFGWNSATELSSLLFFSLYFACYLWAIFFHVSFCTLFVKCLALLALFYFVLTAHSQSLQY